MSPLTLSVEEAAKALGMGRESVMALIRSRQLKVIKVGRKIRVPQAAIDSLIADATRNGVEVKR